VKFMERIRQILKDECGAVPIWVSATGAVFAIYQIYRLMKDMNRKINNTRKENGPVDILKPPVIDGEILNSDSHEVHERSAD